VDKTLIALKRQIPAMGVTKLEVGIHCSKTGRMINRECDMGKLIKGLGWLKQQNSQGANIYIRPTGSQGVLLIDDLTITQRERMEAAGYLPSCVVETSPLNYQAWLRVSDRPIPEALATAVSKVLASEFQGDMNSADWRHYGRLAGFTNRKPQHVRPDGSYPYVLLRKTRKSLPQQDFGTLFDRAYALLDEEEKRTQRPKLAVKSGRKNQHSNTFFVSQMRNLERRYGREINYSKADWMIVLKMVSLGYKREDIAEALVLSSPGLSVRKTGHIEDYVERTLTQAYMEFET
jgi:hypothetical protein